MIMEYLKHIKSAVTKFINQTKKIPVPIKIIVYGYFILLAFSYLMYVAVVLAAIWFGAAKINDLHVYMTDLTSPAVVAAVLFISRFFIDTDGNGIADFLEEKDKKGGKQNDRTGN